MMDAENLELNLFRYEGKPLEKGVQVAIYKPRKPIPEDKFVLVDIAARTIEEAAGPPSVAAQFGSSIYVLAVNPANLSGLYTTQDSYTNESFEWVLDQQGVLVTPKDEPSREILRRLVAKAITNQQLRSKWFVERFRIAYHYSYSYSEPLSGGPFEVYQGFIFRPFVYEDGSLVVLVDPKFKFVPRETLRDYIERLQREGRSQDDIQALLRDEFVIDHCPVVTCTLRNTPGSPCRMRGSGKRTQLVELDFSKKPSTAEYGDLIQYNRDKVCKDNGKIAEYMKDSSPIALVQFPNASEPFDYPLERLRKELKLNEVERLDRIKVMEYVRPSMRTRYELTRSFLHHVDQVALGRIELKLVRSFVKAGEDGRPWKNYAIFEEPPLAFAGGKTALDPMDGLETFGPFDIQNAAVSSIKMAIVCYSRKLDLEVVRRFYNDLTNGFQGRPAFKGIKNMFQVKTLEFDKKLVVWNPREINLEELGNPNIVLVIAPSLGFKKTKMYRPVKQKLSKAGVPTQFVMEHNVFGESGKYAGLLKNLALEIYAKTGGTAWTLSDHIDEGKCFIGIDSVSRGRTTYVSVQVFNYRGEWLGGWAKGVPKEKYGEILVSLLQEATRLFSKASKYPAEVVIHKEGSIWAVEKTSIETAVKVKHRVASIMRLGISRVYNVGSNHELIAKRGTFVQVDSDEAVLVTSGPPHQIQGSQKPLTVKLLNPSSHEALRETCREVFLLSLVYGGYTLAVTSRPVTTHYANKAASVVAAYQIEASEELSKKAWFI
jgi:hypothetical protein